MIHGRRLRQEITVTNLEDDPVLTDEFGHALEIEVVTVIKGLLVLASSSESLGQLDRDTTHTNWTGYFFPQADINLDSVLHWTDEYGVAHVGNVQGQPLRMTTTRGSHHIEAPVQEISTNE